MAPTLDPIFFSMTPSPNHFSTTPNYGITSSKAPASNIIFSQPQVTTTVCHVFLYSFKQSSTYSLFENSFQQKVLYINQSVTV